MSHLVRACPRANPIQLIVCPRSQVAHWAGHERTRVDVSKLWDHTASSMG